MTKIKRIAPPFSILDVSDADIGEPLEPSRDHIQWSDFAVRISCLNEFDGDTTVTLGPASDVALARPPVFDGVIKTPTRQIVVTTAHLETVLAETVPTTRTRVRIWENRSMEPDEIVIGLG